MKPIATFALNSVRGKGHGLQSEKFCGLKGTKEMIVIYGQGFSRFLVLDQLKTATTEQVQSMSVSLRTEMFKGNKTTICYIV